MFDQRHIDILDILLRQDYISGKEIAERMKISEKTARTRLSELADILQDSPAELQVKKGTGYRLAMKDKELFYQWYNKTGQPEKWGGPQSVEERVLFTLRYLLEQKGFVKRQELCDILFVSEKTVSSDLRQVELMLSQFNLTLEKRKKGLRLQGREFEKRMCILGLSAQGISQRQESSAREDLRRITSIVVQVVGQQYSDYGLKKLVDYLQVMIQRTRQGFLIEGENIDPDVDITLAQRLLDALAEAGILSSIHPAEAFYLMIYMKAGLMHGVSLSNSENLVIPAHVNRIVTQIIQNLFENYSMDLRDNFPLRIALCNHLTHLDIRIRYGLHLDSPMHEEIKSNYINSYMLAQQAVKVISEYYGCTVPSSETDYFAMLFEMYQQVPETEQRKKTVLLVSSYDGMASQYVYFLLRREFGEYIQKIRVCSIGEIFDYDFSDVDLVISSVPFGRDISVPILMLQDYMSELTTYRLREQMQQINSGFLWEYFKEDLFFTEVSGDTPSEVIQEVCHRMAQVHTLPEGFYKSVMRREHLGHTDLGYYSAIPHPSKILTEDTIVAVAILEKPIFWYQGDVQLVILSSISSANKRESRELLRCIGNLISNKASVKKLLEKKNFKTLMELIVK